jgi:hypothetical protein
MDNFYLTVTAGLLWVFLISMSFQLLVAEEKPMRVKHYEVCRAKLFTLYPYEVNQNEWRSCMEVGHGKN